MFDHLPTKSLSHRRLHRAVDVKRQSRFSGIAGGTRILLGVKIDRFDRTGVSSASCAGITGRFVHIKQLFGNLELPPAPARRQVGRGTPAKIWQAAGKGEISSAGEVWGVDSALFMIEGI